MANLYPQGGAAPIFKHPGGELSLSNTRADELEALKHTKKWTEEQEGAIQTKRFAVLKMF